MDARYIWRSSLAVMLAREDLARVKLLGLFEEAHAEGLFHPVRELHQFASVD